MCHKHAFMLPVPLAILLFMAGMLHCTQLVAQDQPTPKPLAPGSTVLLLPGGDLQSDVLEPGSANYAYEMQARAALVSALGRIGYHHVTPQQVHKQLEQRGQPKLCSSVISCDRKALLAALDADAVVIYALWLRNGAPTQLTVSVTREDYDGQASQQVTRDGLANGAKTLLATAMQRAERPARIVVHIASRPRGASVGVDDGAKKPAPAKFNLTPGAHRLTVEKPGYVTVLDQFTLSRDHPSFHREVQLEPVADESLASKPPVIDLNTERDGAFAPVQANSTGNNTADYLLGATFATAAASLLSVGIVMALRDGDCKLKSDPQPNFDVSPQCHTRQNGKNWPLWAGGAAVAALTSGTFFIFTPLASLSTETAGLQFNATF